MSSYIIKDKPLDNWAFNARLNSLTCAQLCDIDIELFVLYVDGVGVDIDMSTVLNAPQLS
jgi:hypothetical protein